MNRAPVAFTWNACASEGRLRGNESPPFTNATELSTAVCPTGVTARGLVEHRHLDRVGAERVDLARVGVRVDERVRPRRRRLR